MTASPRDDPCRARRGEIASPFVSDLVFRFSRTFSTNGTIPSHPTATAARRGAEYCDPLLEAGTARLDPAAIGRVESRLRGIGHPPRTAEEMAETLLRLGDLAPSEIVGPMAVFLADLQGQNRACLRVFPGTAEPDVGFTPRKRLVCDRVSGPESSPDR